MASVPAVKPKPAVIVLPEPAGPTTMPRPNLVCFEQPRAEITQAMAKAYSDAALANVNMQAATRTLETIREALLRKTDAFEIWRVIDNEIGRAEARQLQDVLVELCQWFTHSVTSDLTKRLHTTGLQEWLQVYAEALANWRLELCQALVEEHFPFLESANELLSLDLERMTRYILHERWAEAFPLVSALAEGSFFPVTRAKLFVAAGQIELYHFSCSQKAWDLFCRAEGLAPAESSVVCGLGGYWLKTNDLEKARAYYQRAIEVAPAEAGGYVGMGDVSQKEGDLKAAESWFQEAIRNAASSEDGYGRLLRLYGRPEFIDTCESSLIPLAEHMIALDPIGKYSAYLEVGYAYQQSGRHYEQAHQWFQKAMTLDAQRITAYIAHGMAYLEQNDYDQARPAFAQAIAVAPEAADGYLYSGLIDDLQGQLAEALLWYKRALQRRPEMEGLIRTKIGAVLRKQGQYQAAENEFFQALRADPDNKEPLNGLNSLAKDYYQQQDNADAALRIYAEIFGIRGKAYEDDYKKNKALVFNTQGNAHYSKREYPQAVELYDQAIQLQPEDAVFYSNLAGACERLVSQKKEGLAALDKAIAALQKACELDPQDTDYIERLDLYLERKKIGLQFGSQAIDKLLVVTPIAIEVASDLLPYVEGKEQDSLSERLAQHVDDMRKRILKKFGVTIPSLRFRGNESDLANGTYIIMLSENPIVSETISLDKRLFPGDPKQLVHLGVSGEITNNPLTGEQAGWVTRGDWEIVEKAGVDLWDVIAYPVRHLESVIQSNLVEFVGHQEVANLLETLPPKVSGKVRGLPGGLSALTYVLRGLLNEQVPIVEFKEIVLEFCQLLESGQRLGASIEAIRSIPPIRPLLPGNNGQYRFYCLGPHYEAKIQQSLRQEAQRPILAMEPEDCEEALTAIRDEIGSQRYFALVVETPNVRPFLRELVKIEFPHIPILSRQELLPELANCIVGKVDLY